MNAPGRRSRRLTAAAALLCAVPAAATLTRYQTGPYPAPFYAGGVAYDRSADLVYVTGSTYAADGRTSSTCDCFVGIYGPAGDGSDRRDIRWIPQPETGASAPTEEFSQACFGVVPFPFVPNQAATETPDTVHSVFVYGIGADSVGRQSSQQSQTLVPGTLRSFHVASRYTGYYTGEYQLAQNQVNYPVAVAIDRKVRADTADTTDTQVTPQAKGILYVATMVSTDQYAQPPTFDSAPYYDYTNRIRTDVGRLGIVIEAFRIEEISFLDQDGKQETFEGLQSLWTKSFLHNGFGTDVVAMLVQRQNIVIAGTTKGKTDDFGSPQPSPQSQQRQDGYVYSFHVNHRDKPGIVQRFATVDNQDMHIHHICQLEHSDRDQYHPFLYVVGSTQGVVAGSDRKQIPLHNQSDAFVAQIDADTLETVWIQQLFVDTDRITDRSVSNARAHAWSCAVQLRDTEYVLYVAGTVEGTHIMHGASNNPTPTAQDDIWIAALNTQDGQTDWITQIGTQHGKERIARNGGLAVDEVSQNILVFGDTTGPLFRNKDESATDLFLFSISVNGTILSTYENESHPYNSNTTSSVVHHHHFRFLLFSSVVLAIVYLAARKYLNANSSHKPQRLRRSQHAATDRTEVFKYLQNFDVDDVDLHHSVAGGFHGTYTNELAMGINRADGEYAEDDDAASCYSHHSHSSIVRDSIFMDLHARPQLGSSLGYVDRGGDDDDDDGLDETDEFCYDADNLIDDPYDNLVSAYRRNNFRGRSSDFQDGWNRNII